MLSDEGQIEQRTYQNLQSPLHVTHVEDVSVVIFRGNSKVVSFHWVPGNAVCRKIKDSAVERRICACII